MTNLIFLTLVTIYHLIDVTSSLNYEEKLVTENETITVLDYSVITLTSDNSFSIIDGPRNRMEGEELLFITNNRYALINLTQHIRLVQIEIVSFRKKSQSCSNLHYFSLFF